MKALERGLFFFIRKFIFRTNRTQIKNKYEQKEKYISHMEQ